jgi:hypothetical protein
MANSEHLEILQRGVEYWNKWRNNNKETIPDLNGADLSGRDLKYANFLKSNMPFVKLSGSNLEQTNFSFANLCQAELIHVKLTGAKLIQTNLAFADFTGAELIDSLIMSSNLWGTNFAQATFSKVRLDGSNLSNINLQNATIEHANIYGVSVWNAKTDGLIQKNLVITRKNEPEITVDDIEVAQFIYLILNNQKIRDVIGTIAKKGVLILGRFTPERKKILNSIRGKLRENDFVPIMFDFEKVASRDFTETIKILAGMSRFVIVDITNVKSAPLELQATVPDYKIPFLPIIQKGETQFSMLRDLQQKYNWVLPTMSYSSEESLMKGFRKGILDRALEADKRLFEEKQAPPPEITEIESFEEN